MCPLDVKWSWMFLFDPVQTPKSFQKINTANERIKVTDVWPIYLDLSYFTDLFHAPEVGNKIWETRKILVICTR